MKKWGLASLVLLLLIAAMAEVTFGYKQSPKVPAIDEVVSADFSESYVLRSGDPVPLPLIAANPEDRVVIEKVLEWVRSAKVVGKGPEPMPSMGYHSLVLHLRNNTEVSLTQVRRTSAVVFDTDDGNPVHLDSPNLTAWLWDGWKEDVKLGVAASATPAVQLGLRAASNSVPTGEPSAFTITLK